MVRLFFEFVGSMIRIKGEDNGMDEVGECGEGMEGIVDAQSEKKKKKSC